MRSWFGALRVALVVALGVLPPTPAVAARRFDVRVDPQQHLLGPVHSGRWPGRLARPDGRTAAVTLTGDPARYRRLNAIVVRRTR